MDGHTVQMDGWTRWTDVWVDTRMDGWVDGYFDYIDRWKYGWTDGHIDDGWVGGWVDV